MIRLLMQGDTGWYGGATRAAVPCRRIQICDQDAVVGTFNRLEEACERRNRTLD